jgi:site-specific DNA recombinase
MSRCRQARYTHSAASSETNADPKLLKAIVGAQHWLKQLSNGQSSSIEDLDYNPKVIRQGLRLAFLAPKVAAAALDGGTQIRL